jgi:sugar lactone lactonase YvrE
MKKFSHLFLVVGFVVVSFSLQAQNKQLIKLWQTSATLKTPESAVLHKKTNTLYFSNIDGKPDSKDKQGSIGKINADGTKLIVDWVSGLSAPKGLAIYEGILYVADLDELVSIDLKSGKIITRIPVPGAKFLNDVTIDAKGIIYVSDMHTAKVHRFENGKVSTYLENQPGVNGLLADGEDLYLLENGTLLKTTKTKQSVNITEGIEPSTDGLCLTADKDFLVSCWTGIIYYVNSDGTKYQLLNTQDQQINTADIYLDAEKNILYVPTFFANKIVAYRLE